MWLSRLTGGDPHLYRDTKRDATQMDMTEFFDFQNVPWAAHPFRRNGQRLELAMPRTWDIQDLVFAAAPQRKVARDLTREHLALH
jgi:hypothetical protein